MSLEDMKITLLNGGVITLANLPLEQTLKVVLLVVSIVYTAQRIYENAKKDK